LQLELEFEVTIEKMNGAFKGQSKSARRKQRLIKRGEQIEAARGTNNKGNPGSQGSKPNQGMSRSARRRRAKRQSHLGQLGENPYLRALMRPEDGAGIKVPDLMSFPTATFQLTQEFSLASGTGGDSLGVMITPVMADSANPIVTFAGTSAGSLSSITNRGWTSSSAVTTAFQYFRPVSMVAKVMFIGPSTADGGLIIGSTVPREFSYPANWSAALTVPFRTTFPLKNGVRVVWKPQDNSDLEFKKSTATSLDLPSIYIAATGLPSAVTYVNVRIVLNMEAIPKADSLELVTTAPSPVNLGWLERAASWVGTPDNNVSSFTGLLGQALTTGATLMASRAINRQRQLTFDIV